jgi:ketosteroid isomerase-like protein
MPFALCRLSLIFPKKMKQFLILIASGICLLFVRPNPVKAQQRPAGLAAIETLLQQQADAWNRGDIDAFMQTYWKSDKLLFSNANGVTYGWQPTLDNYKKRYPSREAMGQLTFEVINLQKLNKKTAMMIGSWELERKNDNPGGRFMLIWKKIKGEWKIIADQTSARCP